MPRSSKSATGKPDESKLKACSFFLVRYVPDLVRDEGLNIGLFLHSPEQEYLDCLFTNDFGRIKRLHPQADLELLRELQPHFEQQIKEHESDLGGYIREMQESYSNLIQVTPSRSCLTADPRSEIQELFARYVGTPVGGSVQQDTRMRIKQALTSALDRAGVLRLKLFEKHIPAELWTKKGDPFSFDYGYKPLRVGGRPNGHIKLIHALSLKRDTELAKVLAYTVDRVREREPADLTAVVEARASAADEIAQASQDILEERRIVIQPLAGVDEYAQSVRRELVE